MADCECPCKTCNEPTGGADEADHCDYCWCIAEHCFELGLAIRSFARRCEVEGLRGTVGVALTHDHYCGSQPAEWPCSCGVMRFRAALARLAAMALEER